MVIYRYYAEGKIPGRISERIREAFLAQLVEFGWINEKRVIQRQFSSRGISYSEKRRRYIEIRAVSAN